MSSSLRSQTVERLRAQISAIAEGLTSFEPPFDFTILWALDYDDLFSKPRRGKGAPPEELLEKASIRGRVILSAGGGSGKTSIISRLYRLAAVRDDWPVLIDMRNWFPSVGERWREQANIASRMDLLLTMLGKPTLTAADLSHLPESGVRVLFLDGLNEVDAGTAQEILEVVDEFAARNTRAAVIVTDRLARRDLRAARWALATIAQIPLNERARHVGKEAARNELLGTAFFLDMAIREEIDASSSARAIRKYLRRHSAVTDQGLTRAAKAAFLVYEHLSQTQSLSRSFPIQIFMEYAGLSATSALREADILLEGADGPSYFRHHLFHDYLASAWLVQEPALWTKENFDAMTFQASSFDSLALALEQLGDPGLADSFVRRVYDWNFYATAYALAKAKSEKVSAVTRGMETVLLTMLAEKRWDPIKATAQAVTDALKLLTSAITTKLLKAESLSHLLELTRRVPMPDEELRAWRELFTIPLREPVPDTVVEQIKDPDSLTGWTVANVLRRVFLTETQLARVREMVEETDETVRWRIVHALGAHPSDMNVALMLGRLDDEEEYRWVRYGAIRSLVESAARSEDLRKSIFREIEARVDTIKRHPRILGEFEKAVILREPPEDWADAVGPVIEELWAKADTIESQDHWRQLGYEVQRAGG